MALLAFELPRGNGTRTAASSKKAALTLDAPPNIVELLTPAQRLRTAGELNAAILASQSQGQEPKMPQLLHVMSFGESILASEGKVSMPRQIGRAHV